MAKHIPFISIPEDTEVPAEELVGSNIDDTPVELHTGYEYDYETNDYRFFD